MMQTRHPASSWLAIPACLAFCSSCFAQTTQPPQRQSAHAQTQQQKPPASTPAASSTPASSAPTSLLDQPAHPAKVTLASGKLTVQADNSSLAEILHKVSEAGGMKIEGLLQTGGSGDPRVFGNYGPAAPRDVLSDLLNGTGYNVMMLGETPAGVPRELALTVRTSGGVPNPSPTANSQGNDNDDAIQPTQYQDEPAPQPPPPVDPGNANRVKTPQEMLQELQRLHDQQQQQQQQQQPQETDSQPN